MRLPVSSSNGPAAMLVENALVLFVVKMWKRLVPAFGPRLGEHNVVVLQQETSRAFPAIILHHGIQGTSVVGHLIPALRRQAEASSADLPVEHRASWIIPSQGYGSSPHESNEMWYL